ncbi:MAG: GNAT family N-acetyltransferase [Nocardioidaceae bacterium]|nr:GNAT family N-acetyltransferase [Nocardioidaceae bacterium]NUS51219.1 GNAT family N-acetyltransferase [Nocardioidaceae bacterium]
MARKLARLTLDNLDDLPPACRTCVFWELDAVRRQRAQDRGEASCEKEAWVSHVLLEWGSCGRVAYVDGEPAGYVLYAPPAFVPGAEAFPTAPVGEDAVLLVTAMVYPEYAGAGLGRMLMQTAVKDLLKRGGIRALEAFGDTKAPDRNAWAVSPEYGDCVLPADYLLGVGFKTQRPHPRYPRMRLELRSVASWRDEVESALEKLLGAVRPARQPAAGRSHRVMRDGEGSAG